MTSATRYVGSIGWLMFTACGHSTPTGNAAGAPAGSQASAATLKVSAVRAIDWGTRKYSVTLMEGEGELPFAVVDRRYQAVIGKGAVERLTLSAPTFADLTGDGEEEAIVRFDYQPGDRGDEGFDTLFVFTADKPTPLGRVEGGKLAGHSSIAAFVVEPIVGPHVAGTPGNKLVVTRRNIDEPQAGPWLESFVWDGRFFSKID
jgi:hypothetical protein